MHGVKQIQGKHAVEHRDLIFRLTLTCLLYCAYLPVLPQTGYLIKQILKRDPSLSTSNSPFLGANPRLIFAMNSIYSQTISAENVKRGHKTGETDTNVRTIEY